MENNKMATALWRGPLRGLLTLTLLLGLTGCGVNTIPTLDEQVKASWGQVENQYQRRADLIPNLVATVKGYASHEQETLKAVTDARARVGSVQASDP
ncbi:LemA family protein, partial [Aeromonas taiwanensis]